MSDIFSACRIAAVLAATLAVIAAPAQTSAQASTSTATQATSGSQQTAQQATPPAKVAPVTTTVVVHGEAKDDYLPDLLSTGTLDSLPLSKAPLSASVITRAVLNDQVARLLSDVVRNDAAIGEDYAPVGYYSGFQIRGFAIDFATGFQINGMTITGEQDVPLENKQSVEFLKGLAGVESGVASAGGLIGFVTKRPALVRAIDVATDHRGSSYGAVDIGRFFGSRKQVGARINAGGERIKSYLDGADGWRGVGAGAADWRIDAHSTLTADFEYQHKTERSQSGYQLLGGTALPDISRIYRSTMLGLQPWEKPNIFDVYNTSARYTRDLSENWRVQVAGSLSHSLIDDNVVYAYGNSLGDPYYFFAPDGTYDIYDYRNPGELRINAVGQALVNGRLKAGAFTHEISAGGEIFRRSVRMPGTPPDGSPDWIADGSVYQYIGSENIYQSQSFFAGATDINGVRMQAGPRVLKGNDHQSSLLLQDRIRIPGGFQLIAGGRYDALHDHNFSASKNTDKNIWLPQFAATYNPIANVTVYGNYGVLLSLGQQAPWWVQLNGSNYLDPYYTRQAEIGVKVNPTERLLVTAAFFRMHAPYFYPRLIPAADSTCGADEFDPTSSNNFCYEADGREHHEGIEINAEGKAARWLRLTGSATAMNAKSVQTSTAAYNDKQVINQPHVRTALFADLTVPFVHGLHLLPGWNYTGRKEATRDDNVSVTGYNIFNLGARYTPGGEKGKITFRLFADNVTNKTYWKDTGTSGGDSFLYIGAPTTIRLAAHYTF